jgi:hypothetical protein
MSTAQRVNMPAREASGLRGTLFVGMTCAVMMVCALFLVPLPSFGGAGKVSKSELRAGFAEMSALRIQVEGLLQQNAAHRADRARVSTATTILNAPAELLLSPSQVISYAARQLFFPSREHANPVRHAWASLGLDWHNLVKPVGGVAKPGSSTAPADSLAAAAEAALYRDRREIVKAQLIDLLLGHARVTASSAELLDRAAASIARVNSPVDNTPCQTRDDLSGSSNANASASQPSPPTQSWLVTSEAASLPRAWLGEYAPVVESLLANTVSLPMSDETSTDDPAFPRHALADPLLLLKDRGVFSVASKSAINAAYQRRLEAYHPDATGSLADDLDRFRSPTADHGPLAKYSACSVVADKCWVHGTARECIEDELCGWCRCVDVYL